MFHTYIYNNWYKYTFIVWLDFILWIYLVWVRIIALNNRTTIIIIAYSENCLWSLLYYVVFFHRYRCVVVVFATILPLLFLYMCWAYFVWEKNIFLAYKYIYYIFISFDLWWLHFIVIMIVSLYYLSFSLCKWCHAISPSTQNDSCIYRLFSFWYLRFLWKLWVCLNLSILVFCFKLFSLSL